MRRLLAVFALLLSLVNPRHASASPVPDVLGRFPRGLPAAVANRAGSDAGGSAPALTVGDGAGGFYMAYVGGGYGGNFIAPPPTSGQNIPISKLYLVRIGADGAPAAGWPAEGIPVTTTPDNHGGAALALDGAGGVIVAWDDYTAFDATIRAQRVDASGARLWGAGGVLLAAGAGLRYVEDAEPDGSGGALVSWSDSGLDPGDDVSDIYLQRVTAAGAIAAGWPADGVATCAATGRQFGSRIVPDGAGGAIVAWYDFRSLAALDAYAQHVSSAGAPLWTADGILVGEPASANPLFDLTTDGAGGIIVAYAKFEVYWNMYAQRYDGAGAAQWAAGGVALSLANVYQSRVGIAPDGAGGAIACWYDYRNSMTNPDIYAQRVTAAGAISPGWAANGVWVGNSNSDQNAPIIAAGGSGDALIEWEVGSSPDTIVAQRLLGTGLAAGGWAAGGVVVTGPDSRATSYPAQIFADGASGLICLWNDSRDSGAGNGFYAQRLGPTGLKLWDESGAPVVTFVALSGLQTQPGLARRTVGGLQAAWAQWEGGSASLALREFENTGAAAGPTATLSTSPAWFMPPVVPDLLGGAFLCWTEIGAGGEETRIQRIDGGGIERWAPGGVIVPDITQPAGAFHIGMVPDGSGGVILARGDEGSGGILLQRLDSSGAPKWPGGVVINSDGPFAGNASLVPDDSGGVIVVWGIQLLDAGTLQYYVNLAAQRVDSTGALQWGPTGILVAPGVREQAYARAAADGYHGAIVCWIGDELFPDADIWAQRIGPGGTIAPGWPSGGVHVCAASGRQLLPDLAPDQLGGAYIAWWDGRAGATKMYAQHLDAVGEPLWTADGIPVATTAGPQYLQTVQADNTGGLLVCWLDGGGTSWDVFVQRMDSAGAPQWTAGGVGVCTDPAPQYAPILLVGNIGGTFVAWEDARVAPIREVLFQRVNPFGVTGWTPNGVTSALASLESASAGSGQVRLRWWSDGSLARATLERAEAPGGWRALAVLEADGTGRLGYEDRDVAPGRRYGYRLKVEHAGTVETLGEVWIDVPLAAEFALEGARPNPGAGDLVVAFSLPAGGAVTLEVLDVSGRRVLRRGVDAAAGRNVLNLGAFPAAPGVYLMRLTQGARSLERRLVRTR